MDIEREGSLLVHALLAFYQRFHGETQMGFALTIAAALFVEQPEGCQRTSDEARPRLLRRPIPGRTHIFHLGGDLGQGAGLLGAFQGGLMLG